MSDNNTDLALFDAIADSIATARTKWLMGERDEAQRLAKEAARLYDQNAQAISRVNGYRRLDRAFDSLQDLFSSGRQGQGA